VSSYYGIVFPEFWTGQTGKAIRAEGKDAQILALYQMTCRYATMIGLYRLLVDDVRAETGLAEKGLVRGFEALGRLGFSDYDAATQHVWVREMAKYRLNLQRKSPLDVDDNRVKGSQNLYDRLGDNPFLGPFFDRYAKEIRLKRRRDMGACIATPLQVAPSKGLEGPRSQITDTRDQVQGSEKSTGAARRPVEIPMENSVGTFALYCVIADEALVTSLRDDQTDSPSNVSEIFTRLCAQRHLAYDGDLTRRAIDAVLANRDRHEVA
jgi:hypothetical protein